MINCNLWESVKVIGRNTLVPRSSQTFLLGIDHFTSKTRKDRIRFYQNLFHIGQKQTFGQMSLSLRPASCVIPHCGGCWPPPSHHYWTRTLSLMTAVCDPSLCDLTWCRGNICKSSRARHTRRLSLTRRDNTARSSPLLCAAVFRQKWSRSVNPRLLDFTKHRLWGLTQHSNVNAMLSPEAVPLSRRSEL